MARFVLNMAIAALISCSTRSPWWKRRPRNVCSVVGNLVFSVAAGCAWWTFTAEVMARCRKATHRSCLKLSDTHIQRSILTQRCRQWERCLARASGRQLLCSASLSIILVDSACSNEECGHKTVVRLRPETIPPPYAVYTGKLCSAVELPMV